MGPIAGNFAALVRVYAPLMVAPFVRQQKLELGTFILSLSLIFDTESSITSL